MSKKIRKSVKNGHFPKVIVWQNGKKLVEPEIAYALRC